MSPCKGCENRTPTCHGKECVAYTEWAANRRQETIKTNQSKAALSHMYNYGRIKKWHH